MRDITYYTCHGYSRKEGAPSMMIKQLLLNSKGLVRCDVSERSPPSEPTCSLLPAILALSTNVCYIVGEVRTVQWLHPLLKGECFSFRFAAAMETRWERNVNALGIICAIADVRLVVIFPPFFFAISAAIFHGD